MAEHIQHLSSAMMPFDLEVQELVPLMCPALIDHCNVATKGEKLFDPHVRENINHVTCFLVLSLEPVWLVIGEHILLCFHWSDRKSVV